MSHSLSGKQHLLQKKRSPHTIIIARGSHVSHFTIKPWMSFFLCFIASILFILYVGSTLYLAFRDDFMKGSVARSAYALQSYEDRVSALRAQVDRLTSRQMLDQYVMENKVNELISKQKQLLNTSGRLAPLLKSTQQELQKTSFSPPKGDNGLKAASPADRADELFANISSSLQDIETQQLSHVRSLTQNAVDVVDKITFAFHSAGLTLPNMQEGGQGGPYVQIDQNSIFDVELQRLEKALTTLDHVKSEAQDYPIFQPLNQAIITSGFGVRVDPLLGTQALHSGIDFKGEFGTPIKAAAAGVVVTASYVGGYGNMVEIKHQNGLTTRYGHMSDIYVRQGTRVEAGTLIGAIGSTGRSTGPHLHYEVRSGDTAVNPKPYLEIGKIITPIL